MENTRKTTKETTRKTTRKTKITGKQSITPEKAFLLSFLALQSELPEFKRTEKVVRNGRSYSYAPLPEIRRILQPYLTKHGFVVSWDSREVGDKIEYTCILTHIEGHSRKASILLDKDKTIADLNNIQAVGSSTTYAQRYTLIMVLGLTSVDNDDDAILLDEVRREIIPDPLPKPKSDGEHNKVVQEILNLSEKEVGK